MNKPSQTSHKERVANEASPEARLNSAVIEIKFLHIKRKQRLVSCGCHGPVFLSWTVPFRSGLALFICC